MTNLTQTQPIQATQPVNDKHTAAFDVALSFSPVEENLDSEYFQAYLKEVVKTGNTPF